jgi:hypothetical protein
MIRFETAPASARALSSCRLNATRHRRASLLDGRFTRPLAGCLSPEFRMLASDGIIEGAECRSAAEQGVPRFLRIVFFCDEVGKGQQEMGTTDGIHQRVNSRKTAAPNQRGWMGWRLLIAGDVGSAISRPRRLLRRRLAGGDFPVSSFDETHQWFHPVWPGSAFGCGYRVGKFPG